MDFPAESVPQRSRASSDARSGAALEHLESLLDLIADDLDGLDSAGRPDGSDRAGPGPVAGSSAQAQENRAIHISRARLAAERAREARQRLPGLVVQAREGLRRAREYQERIRTDPSGVSAALSTAMSAVAPAADPEESLRSVVRGAVAGIPTVDVATISLRDRKARLLRTIASEDTGDVLSARQTSLREGPCVDVARTGTAVEAPDLAAGDARWPAFASVATASGVRSVLALPLCSGYPTGTLSLWSRRSHAFGATSRVLADLFVQHASLAIENAERYRSLQVAIETRDLIGQAKGVLMARQGIGADEAFRLLVATSQSANLKLVDVARWTVENLAGPGDS